LSTLSAREHRESFSTSRIAEPSVKANEALVHRLFFAPDQRGPELQGITGAKGMNGKYPAGATPKLFRGKNRVRILNQNLEPVEGIAQDTGWYRRLPVASVNR